MRGPLAVLAMAALPVAAQTLPFSTVETETCLAELASAEARVLCVGRSAAACIDTPDGRTTVGMGYCLDQERAYWDARLNAAYTALVEIERAQDAEMTELGSSAPRMEPALRDMQRAWIAFRDAACAYEASQWGGGTGAGPAYIGCLMTQTGHQALELEARLGGKQAQ